VTPPVRSPAAEVVEDWTALAKELIKKWSDYGSYVSTKLDQGAYNDADTATTDLAGGVSLTIESGVKLAWECLDSFTILSYGFGRQVIDSQVFIYPNPDVDLALQGNLTSGSGDSIPKAAVHILAFSIPGKTTFKLRIDATGHRGGTYSGTVLVTPSGQAPDPVQVWITVP
jgi:hypothetical protein